MPSREFSITSAINSASKPDTWILSLLKRFYLRHLHICCRPIRCLHVQHRSNTLIDLMVLGWSTIYCHSWISNHSPTEQAIGSQSRFECIHSLFDVTFSAPVLYTIFCVPPDMFSRNGTETVYFGGEK